MLSVTARHRDLRRRNRQALITPPDIGTLYRRSRLADNTHIAAAISFDSLRDYLASVLDYPLSIRCLPRKRLDGVVELRKKSTASEKNSAHCANSITNLRQQFATSTKCSFSPFPLNDHAANGFALLKSHDNDEYFIPQVTTTARLTRGRCTTRGIVKRRPHRHARATLNFAHPFSLMVRMISESAQNR